MAVSQPGHKPPESLLHRIYDSDIFYSFIQSPVTVLSALVTAVFFIAAGFAPWLAPFDSFDPATLVGASSIFLVVAALAAIIPAMKAARIPPAVALRST